MARTSEKTTKGPKPMSKKVAATKKPRLHRKLPGFNAFMTTPAEEMQKARTGEGPPKMVTCKEVAAPETGIHSREWASKIAPNTSPLFKLHTELRIKIWEEVIKAAVKAGVGICPFKYLDKFTTKGGKKLGKKMIGLYTLCRQAYVDIYGSALLYRIHDFRFVSSTRMLNYLSVINPYHRNAIRSIVLECDLVDGNVLNTKKLTWSMLQSMSSLQSLHLRITGDLTNKEAKKQFTEKLRNDEGLKEIWGLKEFKMQFPLLSSFNMKQHENLTALCNELKERACRRSP